MEIEVRQQLYYSNKKIISVKEIAESLIALENLIQQSKSVVESIFPGTTISSIDVFISKLHSNSIWEDLIIKFIFGGQERFDQFITDFRNKIKMDVLIDHPFLFSVILGSLVLAGGGYYLIKHKPHDSVSQKILEVNNTLIVNVGAEYLKMDPKELQKLIVDSVKDKDKLASNAIKIVGPAKKDPNTTITFNNDERLRISSEFVSAMPNAIPDDVDEEFIQEYQSLYMEVRAIDLDSTKRGWAVVVPNFGNKRIKMQIDSEINVEQMLERRHFYGDATVIFKISKDGIKQPVLVFLRKIIDKDGNEFNKNEEDAFLLDV